MIHDVLVEGQREVFAKWIAERGGVTVWKNQDLSNPSAPPCFTPAKDQDGKDRHPPHWAYTIHETITDLSRFRFVEKMKQVAKVRIALDRKQSNFLKFKLTDASSKKLKKVLAEMKEEHKIQPVYHFDDNQAIVEIPVFA